MHMMKFLLPVCLLLTLASPIFAQGSFGEDRAGTEGFQFTKIAVDPRSAAMGNSNMADAYDASSLYWNPALSARLEGSNVMLSHALFRRHKSRLLFCSTKSGRFRSWRFRTIFEFR